MIVRGCVCLYACMYDGTQCARCECGLQHILCLYAWCITYVFAAGTHDGLHDGHACAFGSRQRCGAVGRQPGSLHCAHGHATHMVRACLWLPAYARFFLIQHSMCVVFLFICVYLCVHVQTCACCELTKQLLSRLSVCLYLSAFPPVCMHAFFCIQ